MISARLESGVTFGWWNWMHVRLRQCYSLQVTPINYWRNCADDLDIIYQGHCADDLDILEVTFDSKVTFENHLRSVSRAAFQTLGIMKKSWRVFLDRLILGRRFQGFVLLSLEYSSVVWCSAAGTHLKQLDCVVSGASFLTVCVCVWVWHFTSTICGSILYAE